MKKLAMNSLKRMRIDTGMPTSTKHKQLNPLAQRRHGSGCKRKSGVLSASISFSRGFQDALESESKSPVSMPNAVCATLACCTCSSVSFCSWIAGVISERAYVEGLRFFVVEPVKSSTDITYSNVPGSLYVIGP